MEELIRKMVAGGLDVTVGFSPQGVAVHVVAGEGSQVSATLVVPEGKDHITAVTEWLQLIDGRTKVL
jgi:hypothetical protein